MLLKTTFKLGIFGVAGMVGSLMLLLGSNLWSYSRLTNEVDVGTISFERAGDAYNAVFNEVGHPPVDFVLHGDEWQLDTRIIKWKSWAVLLGKDTLYQLDRISGRYRDPVQAIKQMPGLVDLSDSHWLDIWSWAREHPDLFFMVDAEYGSSVFLPMVDGATYRISMSNSGVLARRIKEDQ